MEQPHIECEVSKAIRKIVEQNSQPTGEGNRRVDDSKDEVRFVRQESKISALEVGQNKMSAALTDLSNTVAQIAKENTESLAHIAKENSDALLKSERAILKEIKESNRRGEITWSKSIWPALGVIGLFVTLFVTIGVLTLSPMKDDIAGLYSTTKALVEMDTNSIADRAHKEEQIKNNSTGLTQLDRVLQREMRLLDERAHSKTTANEHKIEKISEWIIKKGATE